MRTTLTTSYLCAITLGLAALLLPHAMSPLPPAKVSAELKRLFEEDQADRRDGLRGEELRQRDSSRRQRVDELLSADLIIEPEDRFRAAVIYQHSTQVEDILKAHALAVAAAMDGHEQARWLAAASLDRYLKYREEEQFFGTQFEQDEFGKWQPGRIDEAVTPSLRDAYGLPSLEELERRAEEWN